MISEKNMSAMKWLKRVDYLAMAALLFIYVIGVMLILSGDPKVWVDLIYDDGYYYLGIVRSLAASGVSSFLPPFETNGYQPLWVLVLTGVALVFGTSEVSLALQLYTISFIFIGWFAFLSRRYYGLAFPAIASAAIFSKVTFGGMETTMMPAFILVFFVARSWKLKGIFASLIFLTRLDALALVAARDAYDFIVKGHRQFGHYWILFPVVFIYFIANYLIFDTAVPVSGLAKSVGSVMGENLSVYYLYAAKLKLPIIILITTVVAARLLSKKVTFECGREMAILFTGLLIISTYYALRSGWIVWPWYYWPAMMLLFYSIHEVAQLLSDRAVWSRHSVSLSRRCIAGVLVLIVVGYALIPAKDLSRRLLIKYQEQDSPRETYAVKNVELASYIRDEGFPEETFFAMGDRAGSFGFFLGPDYRFIHTEGLVGPFDYYQHLKEDSGAEFIRENDVEFLIADRDRFLEYRDIYGVVEPIQAMSSRYGPYILCFKKSEIVYKQTYTRYGSESNRYIFDLSAEVECPPPIINRFKELRKGYGALRKFSLYAEYPESRGWLLSTMNELVELPPGL